jgi:hypothetical protein
VPLTRARDLDFLGSFDLPHDLELDRHAARLDAHDMHGTALRCRGRGARLVGAPFGTATARGHQGGSAHGEQPNAKRSG